MTTHTFVQVAADGPGKKIDCGTTAFNDGSAAPVYRQVGQIGDPTALDAIMSVKTASTPAVSTDGAGVVVLRDPAPIAGSTGVDYSTNEPTAPNIGATTFGGSSAYAAYVLLSGGTIAADITRKGLLLVNQSASPAVAVLDDGVVGTGGAPANATVLVLNPSGSVGPMDRLSLPGFFGRIRLFAASSGAFIGVQKL